MFQPSKVIASNKSMKGTSKRFRQLRTRVNQLKRHLLPSTFSPIGDYSSRQIDRAKGFRLLVHAEIESYLEDVSVSVVTNAIKQWKSGGNASRSLVSFLASYHSSWNIVDTLNNEQLIAIAKSRRDIKDSVNAIIDLAQTQFHSKVKSNHGIKEENFLLLILPTGIDPSELDQTWITNLDSYGSLRGEIAHKSHHTTGLVNPKDESDKVTALIKGLEDLDTRLQIIMK